MSKQIVPQYAFNAGELSPSLRARADFDKYSKSLETASNCYVHPHGAVIRRSGSKYITSTKVVDKETRLIPFVFNNQGDSLILEFGHLYIRFFKDEASVGAPYEVVTTYTSGTLSELSYVQYGNIMYLAHPNHAPRVLTRIADDNWSLVELPLSPAPLYVGGFYGSGVLSVAATTGLARSFSSAASDFLAADVGRQIQNLTGTGIAVITQVTNSTTVVADIVEDFPNTNNIGVGDWKLDLSPIAELDPDGMVTGSIINIVSKKLDSPQIENGNFLNNTSGWTNISAGSGTAGWDTTNRQLQLVGAGNGNEGKATQPVSNLGSGRYTVTFDTTGACTLLVGTTSGAQDFGTVTVAAGVKHTLTFTTTNYAGDAYFTFSSEVDMNVDNVELSSELDTFKSGDLDAHIMLNGGVVRITEVQNAYTVSAVVLKGLNNTDSTFNWDIGHETWNVVRGYPQAVTIFQERLCFAGTTVNPVGLWLSEPGIFTGFGVGADNEDSISVDLSAGQIKWLAPNKDLIVGTSTGEVGIMGDTSGGALTPSNIKQIPRTFYGSDSQTVQNIGSETLFIQGGGKKLRSMSYSFSSDGYAGEDLLFLADHLPNDIKDLAYSYSPNSHIFCVNGDGSLLVGTYQRDQQVMGWTKYVTDGDYENVAVLPSSGNDDVYVVVKRVINGQIKRYIELFKHQEGVSSLDGFSDSYATYNAPITLEGITKADPGVVTATGHGLSDGDNIKIVSAGGMTEVNLNTYVVANKTTNTFELNDQYGNNLDTSGFSIYTSGGQVHKLVTNITGLGHLEGKEVQIKTDGATHAPKTVSSGSITLDAQAYQVVIGLPYTTTIKTLNTQWNSSIGSMQGQNQRKVAIFARVHNSTVPVLNENQFLPTRSSADNQDQPVNLFTGDLEYSSTAWDKTGSISFTISDPLPFNLQGIFAVVQGNNK